MRNLEREIGRVCRKVARAVAEGQTELVDASRPRRCASSSAPERFFAEVAERTGEPGVATGLAWTPNGGDILFIEATQDGRQEGPDAHRPARRRDEGVGAGGAQLRPRRAPTRLGIEPDFFENCDIHIHVPAGAVPEGRPVGRRHDRDRARLAADRTPGAARRSR